MGFTMQLDEATDVASLAILHVFVRCLFEERVHEVMLLCQTFETFTKGQDIFNISDTFVQKNYLSCDLCTGVCNGDAE